jgi:hypothetical protein
LAVGYDCFKLVFRCKAMIDRHDGIAGIQAYR